MASILSFARKVEAFTIDAELDAYLEAIRRDKGDRIVEGTEMERGHIHIGYKNIQTFAGYFTMASRVFFPSDTTDPLFTMFTGIVEDVGEIATLDDAAGGTSLTVVPGDAALLSDAHLGDSIAINGVCLTVTALDDARSRFVVGVAPETLRLTNLGALAAGARVNLERAVRADTRMGGHFVQGHVDTVATVTRVAADGNAQTMRFAPRSRDVLRHIVYKGFVALDGTSLTVTAVNDAEGWWEVMLIVYTQTRVALASKAVGDTVNVEVDVLSKYAEKSIAGYLDTLAGGGLDKLVEDKVAQILAKK